METKKMKRIVKKFLLKFYKIFNMLPFNNRYCFGGLKIKNSGALLFRCRFKCKGKGNTIILKKGAIVSDTTFHIYGNSNTIILGENTVVSHGDFYIEDNCNKISIGAYTHLMGKNYLTCIEGKQITIGEDCLFSKDIVLRTGDSHSLLDEEGNRINLSEDVRIGNHVWIGYRALINKGVSISDNSIIGTGSVVTKSFDEKNIVIAGVPAVIVKKDVNWCAERI
jgi:acetyltransferase-like isoleucine patch superfamily enzyme